MNQGWSKRGAVSSGSKWTQHITVQCARNFTTVNWYRVSRQDSERVFQSRVQRAVFGTMREEVTRGWKKLFKGLYNTYCLPNYITYFLTPWSRVLLEKPIGSQLVKNFPGFYETRRFLTSFTSSRHLSLSWASPIQSIPPHSEDPHPLLRSYQSISPVPRLAL